MAIFAKNKSVTVRRKRYEIFYSTEIAQKIHRRLTDNPTTKTYLDFVGIEEVVTSGALVDMTGGRYLILRWIGGTQYAVVCFLSKGRCIIKSGRVNNYQQFYGYGR